MTSIWIRKIGGMAAVFVALMADTGLGLDYHWNNSAGGGFSTAGNWTPSGPPSTADRAAFSGNWEYDVAINTPVTNAVMSFQQGDVTFSAGSAYFYATAMQIGTQRLKRAVFTMDNCSGGVGGLVVANDTADGASGSLTLTPGSRLQSGGAIAIGGNNNSFALTGTVVVSGATLSTASNFNLTVGFGGVGQLIITNGGFVDCKNFYATQNKGKTNFPMRSFVTIGGGTGTSILYVHTSAQFGNLGTYPNGYQYFRQPATTELIIYSNGRVYQQDGIPSFNAGSTVTLAGGEYYSRDADLSFTGGVVRGSGQIRCLLGQVRTVSLRKSAGYCDWPWTTVFLTNYAAMSPGTPEAPIGVIELKDWKGALEVRPGCRLDFDLAGTTPSLYDRIVVTNGAVYLGNRTSPGAGGAVINVTLTNNWMPSEDAAFDVLVATNIIESDLSLVSINYPVQPAGFTWSSGIVTNIVPGYTNEILRISAKGSGSKGTMITIW